MNTITKNLGLSTILFAALTSHAQAEEVKVTHHLGTHGEFVTHTLECEDSSGSSKVEEIMIPGGGLGQPSFVKRMTHRYKKCKIVNTEVFNRD